MKCLGQKEHPAVPAEKAFTSSEGNIDKNLFPKGNIRCILVINVSLRVAAREKDHVDHHGHRSSGAWRLSARWCSLNQAPNCWF
uniref:Uncharacterized protein n=1 Tax=Rhizophora mucronata TaxID=61149 RepID=A0A2P2KKU1_RHIMU